MQNIHREVTQIETIAEKHSIHASAVVETQDIASSMHNLIKRMRYSINNNNNSSDVRVGNSNSDSSSDKINNNKDINQKDTVINGDQNNCDNGGSGGGGGSSYFKGGLVAEKYRLFEQAIGSSLFRCINVNTQQELVCKIVSRDNYTLLSAHHRLNSHRRVQSIHEVVIGDGREMFLLFPKAHGDLHSYVRHRKRLRENEAKRLFRQIAETVQVCHQNGIVLRDLKLRKFVFADAEQTELKLESFEDAVVLEEPESDWLHDKRGCPAYVSPEILKTGQYSGKGADMWSLGVILYTMIVGRYPFSDKDHLHLFARISSGSFIIPDCVSARARCLIRSLLRKEPSERLTSDDILYHPWLMHGDETITTTKKWALRTCDQIVPESSFYDD